MARLTNEQMLAVGEWVNSVLEKRGRSARTWEYLEGEVRGWPEPQCAVDVRAAHRLWDQYEWRRVRTGDALHLSLDHRDAGASDGVMSEQWVRTEDAQLAEASGAGPESGAVDLLPAAAQEALRVWTAGLREALLLRPGVRGAGRWRPYRQLKVGKDEALEVVRGAGMVRCGAGMRCWSVGAVILRTAATGEVREVLEECRAHRYSPKSQMAKRYGKGTRMVCAVQRYEMDGKAVDLRMIGSRVASLLQVFLGPECGIKNQVELGELTGRTKAAVSSQQLGTVKRLQELGAVRGRFRQLKAKGAGKRG